MLLLLLLLVVVVRGVVGVARNVVRHGCWPLRWVTLPNTFEKNERSSRDPLSLSACAGSLSVDAICLSLCRRGGGLPLTSNPYQVATKEDLLSLQSEINEKVFSSTLRYGR